MLSAELGMVVSRPCWFLFFLMGRPSGMRLWPFGVPRRRKKGGAAWDRSRGPGWFLLWCVVGVGTGGTGG